MRDVEVTEIWVDDETRLCVRVADKSRVLTHIYRAASGTARDDQIKAVRSPLPREWSYADWFVQITKDARSECGLDLVLADDRTMASSVGDDRLRQEARDLFARKQWKAAVAKLEALKYPQFMDAADRRRLEIARKRSQTE